MSYLLGQTIQYKIGPNTTATARLVVTQETLPRYHSTTLGIRTKNRLTRKTSTLN